MEQTKSMIYAPIDTNIIEHVHFYLDYDPQLLSDPEAPEILSKSSSFELGPRIAFPLQFFPEVTSDNKSGNFKAPGGLSQEQVFYSEPKQFNGSSDRKFSFKLTYIADGGIWSYSTIKSIAKFSKSLFYLNRLATLESEENIDDGFLRVPLLVIEKFYGIIEEKSTWALTQVDITHGKKVIKHNDGIVGPIKTEITFTCQEWTRMQDNKGGVDPNLAIVGLVDKPTALWY